MEQTESVSSAPVEVTGHLTPTRIHEVANSQWQEEIRCWVAKVNVTCPSLWLIVLWWKVLSHKFPVSLVINPSHHSNTWIPLCAVYMTLSLHLQEYHMNDSHSMWLFEYCFFFTEHTMFDYITISFLYSIPLYGFSTVHPFFNWGIFGLFPGLGSYDNNNDKYLLECFMQT